MVFEYYVRESLLRSGDIEKKPGPETVCNRVCIQRTPENATKSSVREILPRRKLTLLS